MYPTALVGYQEERCDSNPYINIGYESVYHTQPTNKVGISGRPLQGNDLERIDGDEKVEWLGSIHNGLFPSKGVDSFWGVVWWERPTILEGDFLTMIN